MALPNTIHILRSHIIFAILLILAAPVTPLALTNITITLPPGSSDHGKPGLLCTPTQPLDLLIFYLLNYVAHAATVLTRPGERADDYFVAVIGSLLFPTLGLYRGIEAILSGAVFVRDDDLRKAARSGALCIVVRGADWRPQDGDVFRNIILKRATKDTLDTKAIRRSFTGETLTQEGEQGDENAVHIIPFSPPSIFSRFGCPVFVHRRIIHGMHSLPPGYRFAILPHDAQFVDSSGPRADRPIIAVSATNNIVKALIAIGQSTYAMTTLYRARGDQISQFGYAAFGLTVAPYAVMSIINLVGNICRPEYPSLYMVESSIMDEARRRGAVFDGAVGRVQEDQKLDVCGCQLSNASPGEDLDEIRFVASDEADDKFEAYFTTTDPLGYATAHGEVEKHSHSDSDSSTDKDISLAPRQASCCMQQRTHPVAPIPYALNYFHTKHADLLLVPCHNPLVRGNQALETTAHRPFLSSVKLHRTYLIGCHSTWRLRFWTSRATTVARRWRWAKYLMLMLVAWIPLIIIGIMSKFESGSIPRYQSSTWRAYTLQWLCFGICTGTWWVFEQESREAMTSARRQAGPWLRATSYVVSASPAVGGFVVVGQMLFLYGTCTWIGN